MADFNDISILKQLLGANASAVLEKNNLLGEVALQLRTANVRFSASTLLIGKFGANTTAVTANGQTGFSGDVALDANNAANTATLTFTNGILTNSVVA